MRKKLGAAAFFPSAAAIGASCCVLCVGAGDYNVAGKEVEELGSRHDLVSLHLTCRGGLGVEQRPAAGLQEHSFPSPAQSCPTLEHSAFLTGAEEVLVNATQSPRAL